MKVGTLLRPLAVQGLIDTIAFTLPIAITKLDEITVFTQEGWTCRKDCRYDHNGETTSGWRQYTRASDGLRVICYNASPKEKKGRGLVVHPARVVVEVSLPRLAGRFNHQQETISAKETAEAIFAATEGLLPWTTHRARVQSEKYGDDARDLEWRVTRIDLARDFPGPVSEVIAALTGTKFRRVRKNHSKIARESSDELLWRGAHTALAVYDKGAEMWSRKNRKKRVTEEWRHAPPVDARGRAELRFRGSDGVSALAERLLRMASHGPAALALPIRRHGRVMRIVLPLDLVALHAVVFQELESLTPRNLPPEKAMNAASIGMWVLGNDEALWDHFCATANPRTVRKYRPLVLAIRRQKHGVDLPARCYTEQEKLDIQAALSSAQGRTAIHKHCVNPYPTPHHHAVKGKAS